MPDVVIAGGGPAGATLALLLGRAGLSVDLFESKRFPRDKPCGEGIMPAGVAVLERMDLITQVGGTTLASVRYHGYGMSAESAFPTVNGRAPVGLAQRRVVLDQVLMSAARLTPGVRVFEDAVVEGAEMENARAVGLRVGGEVRRAALIVGADGINSIVRRSLNLDLPAPSRYRVGFRMHFQLAAGQQGPTRLEIFVANGHELYVAPLPGSELLIGALCDRDVVTSDARSMLSQWIAQKPMLASWLEGATPLTDPAGRAPVTRAAKAGFAPGAVLLGDAARAGDPLTAGGIAHALVTAERLAAIVPRYLDQGDTWLAHFDDDRRRILRRHDWLTKSMLTLFRRPSSGRMTFVSMRAMPRVMRYCLGVAGGVEIQPPKITAISSTALLPNTSATDQKATLSQRAGSS